MFRIFGCCLILVGLLGLAGCSNEGGINSFSKSDTGVAPVKLFAKDQGQNNASRQDGISRSVKISIDQEGLKKAIYRYRLEAKIDTGSQQILGVDLNGDGVGEALVYFTGDEWCISTGCTLVLFSRGTNGFRRMARVRRVKTPVRVGAGYTNGWRDLFVRTGNAGIGEYFVALKFKGNYPQNASTISERLSSEPLDSEVLFERDGSAELLVKAN